MRSNSETAAETDRRQRAVAADGARLDGLRMRPVQTSAGSVISGETLFEFSQDDQVVSARYAGGEIVLGTLVGIVDGPSLVFRYAQVDRGLNVHGGHSQCEIGLSPAGRLQLAEHFTWDSAAGGGINILETVD